MALVGAANCNFVGGGVLGGPGTLAHTGCAGGGDLFAVGTGGGLLHVLFGSKLNTVNSMRSVGTQNDLWPNSPVSDKNEISNNSKLTQKKICLFFGA